MQNLDFPPSPSKPQAQRKGSAIQSILLLSILPIAWGLLELLRLSTPELIIASKSSALLFLVHVLSLLLLLAVFASKWIFRPTHALNLVDGSLGLLSRLGKWNLLPASVILALTPALAFWSSYTQLDSFPVRFSLFWIGTLCASIMVHAWRSSSHEPLVQSWEVSLMLTTLLAIFIYKSATFAVEIQSYPFSLYWSEASRFYYASLFFSERIYGIKTSPTVLHPSRYLLQAIPFLIPNTSIWVHRAWQALLWIGITTLTSLVLVKRLKLAPGFLRMMVLLGCFAYLMIGPVYYHLQIPVILILAFFRPPKSDAALLDLQYTLLPVASASLWAGISRVNWFPIPGLLASLLYFLETPFSLEKSVSKTPETGPRWPAFAKYLLPPALWTFWGIIIAWGAQVAYIYFSGNPASHFSTSFFSSLLWYRLLPNATYPPGIIPGTLLVIFPLGLLFGRQISRINEHISLFRVLNPIRWFAIAAINLVLCIEGFIVSTKIGGGSNLHNMDAFFISWLITIGASLFGHAQLEREAQTAPPASIMVLAPAKEVRLFNIEKIALTCAIAIPTLFTVFSPPPSTRAQHTSVEVEKALAILEKMINNAQHRGGEILFISERQLLTFNVLDDVPLFPEYEKVFLMEMAMANQRDYLQKFYGDLAQQRFSLIISEPLYVVMKTPYSSFAEENNAWVQRVAEPTLCYYKPQKTLPDFNLQMLVPSQESQLCTQSENHP